MPSPVVETNGDLEALVFLLRNFIRGQADEANKVAAECAQWIGAQK